MFKTKISVNNYIMKKIVLTILITILTFVIIVGVTSKVENTNYNGEVLRIHIRANSNNVCDQEVKYIIKQELVNYITPLLTNMESKQDVENIILNNKSNMEEIANLVLKENGFNYESNIKLCSEEFPTRSYNGLTLESGFYDAVIVELGSATGNNWWCVIYPPLCFTEYSQNNEKVVYKSKIMEIIDKILGRV